MAKLVSKVDSQILHRHCIELVHAIATMLLLLCLRRVCAGFIFEESETVF